MHRISLLILILGLPLIVGCNGEDAAMYTTVDRLANGMVVILPGIEGESEFNHDIRRGLDYGGIDCALPIYSWGRPIPGVGMLLNQMDFLGNRLAGVRIAKMIEEYQQGHPGMPVYVVGHSGGGGIAVFTAEAMPEGKQLDGLVLLSASIWSGYDLTKALKHCRSGIVNFYNEADVGLLGIATTIMSNVDGMRGPSAGLIGFAKPTENDPEEKRLAYTKLYEIPVTAGMTGGDDPHAAATRPGFVSVYVVPWVASTAWPAGLATPAAKSNSTSPEPAKALAHLNR